MIVFALCAWFVLFSIFETNKLGKIILLPIAVVSFIVCIPLMLGEFVMLDIWVLLICLCFCRITIVDALEFLLAPLLMF